MEMYKKSPHAWLKTASAISHLEEAGDVAWGGGGVCSLTKITNFFSHTNKET